MHDDGDADITARRDPEGVEQVALGVRILDADRLLRAGQDDRLIQILAHVVEQRRGVTKRVGAVGDDKAVVQVIILADQLGNLHTVRGCDVGGVERKRIDDRDLAQTGGLGQEIKQFFTGKRGRETQSAVAARDRATGRDQKNAFHG